MTNREFIIDEAKLDAREQQYLEKTCPGFGITWHQRRLSWCLQNWNEEQRILYRKEFVKAGGVLTNQGS